MKSISLFVVAGLCTLGASNPGLMDVRNVYLLPMASGLDQYLAIRLTAGGTVQIVTDPQKADAVLTDRIGSAFEERLDDLYKVKPAAGDKDDKKGQTLNDSARPAMQPLSRGKGAIFLVDRKTRNVLWSTYAPGKSSAAAEMNQVANRIAGRFEKDRKSDVAKK